MAEQSGLEAPTYDGLAMLANNQWNDKLDVTLLVNGRLLDAGDWLPEGDRLVRLRIEPVGAGDLDAWNEAQKTTDAARKEMLRIIEAARPRPCSRCGYLGAVEHDCITHLEREKEVSIRLHEMTLRGRTSTDEAYARNLEDLDAKIAEIKKLDAWNNKNKEA